MLWALSAMNLFSVSDSRNLILGRLFFPVYLLMQLLVILISTAWSHSHDDAAVERMTANTIHRLKVAAEDLGVANRYLYINYASASQADDVFAGYGDENVQKLNKIQRAVDPHGIFTSHGLWKGFFKLL